jgi:sulfate/thiosulfate transport system permease protein
MEKTAVQVKIKTVSKKNPTRRILPGFAISLGFTITYLSLLVLVPLTALIIQSLSMDWSAYVHQMLSRRVLSSFSLSIGTSFVAACANGVIGLIIAWALVRYQFPGKRIIDSIVDLPFALPTAVAGIALTTLYAQNGWIGGLLDHFGVKVAYTPVGIIVALSFVGIPFVIRSVQPVLIDCQLEIEEAAKSLGASSVTIFRRILWPQIFPALVTGVSLSFARGLGEYGSVVFISGNMPFKTEIVPLLIMSKLEQFNYSSASAIALTFLVLSFLIMFGINLIQILYRKKYGEFV